MKPFSQSCGESRTSNPHFSPAICCEAVKHRVCGVPLEKHSRHTVKYACECFPLRSWHPRHFPTSRDELGEKCGLSRGSNPRFIVTPLSSSEYGAQALYEELYCARGEMENPIKEQQLMLFADRTSTATIRANHLRLYFSSMTYVLMETLRRYCFSDSKLAHAQCSTIRLKLFKIGAAVRVTVRKVWVSLNSHHPWIKLFEQALENINKIPMYA